jgi:ABC-type amino acid transport substrate-binding protein
MWGRMSKMSIFLKARRLGLILVFILTVFTGFAGCSNNLSSDKNKLKVGMECAYAPFNWIQPTSDHGAVEISGGWYACGYDVYIAKMIAEKMGKELEIVKIDWDGLLPALTSGKIDAIIAGMSATEERRQAIDFTNNYYTSNIVVVLKKDGPYASAKSIDDFKGARITGQLSTVHYTLIDQMTGVEKQVPMEDFPSMISAVNAGKIDGYISEKPAALTAVYTNPTLTYIEFEEGKGFKYSQDDVAIAIGVRQGSELKNEINSVLTTINEDTKNELMNEAVENQPASGN